MTLSMTPAELRSVLGVRVADYSERNALDFIHACVRQKRFQPVAFLNANNANIAWRDREAAKAFNDFVVLPDGIGVDLASKLSYGVSFRANLNGTDFVPNLLLHAEQPMRIGLIGAAPGIADKAVAGFEAIEGRHDYRVFSHGYFEDADQSAILNAIGQWRPDILLVALGVPRQEKWIKNHVTADHCTVPIAVGALFDFVAGTVPRAPRWVRAMRCEWIYRLLIEPGRLGKRYIVGNPLFLIRVLRQKLTAKHAKVTQ